MEKIQNLGLINEYKNGESEIGNFSKNLLGFLNPIEVEDCLSLRHCTITRDILLRKQCRQNAALCGRILRYSSHNRRLTCECAVIDHLLYVFSDASRAFINEGSITKQCFSEC